MSKCLSPLLGVHVLVAFGLLPRRFLGLRLLWVLGFLRYSLAEYLALEPNDFVLPGSRPVLSSIRKRMKIDFCLPESARHRVRLLLPSLLTAPCTQLPA